MYLQREGFKFSEACNAQEAIKKAQSEQPQLILLDVHLPDLDGIETCRKLRQITNVPILFLSCKDSEFDKVVGLSIGGDDYIGKPVGMNELIARIKAHLRRYYENGANQLNQKKYNTILTATSITLDTKRFDCFVNGQKIQLSSKEFELLNFFMLHPFQVLSSEHLLEYVWGYDSNIDTKTVAVHIGNLRRKLGDDPRNPATILTLRGIGYKFNEEVYLQ